MGHLSRGHLKFSSSLAFKFLEFFTNQKAQLGCSALLNIGQTYKKMESW
jgi:hypothetical protein